MYYSIKISNIYKLDIFIYSFSFTEYMHIYTIFDEEIAKQIFH